MNFGAQEMGYGATPGWAGNHAGYGSMMQHTGQGSLGLLDPGVAAAAAAAAGSLQGGAAAFKPDGTLSYAALREAAAVNTAADCAAQDALRSIASAQATMHAVLHPDPTNMGLDGGSSSRYGGADESASNRRRSTAGASAREHAGAAALLAVGGGGGGGGGRPNKGLRHFSMKVCEKVESKGTTSYNEVADELVAELKDGTMEDGICYDEKNIRRRVYDAINVLMALDIIAKEKKAIIWRGFPTSRSAAQQAQRLQGEQYALLGELGRKASYLSELVGQQKALKHLLERNMKNPNAAAPSTPLHLPFILVQAKPDATVEVQISEDMKDVSFNFYNYPFEIHDDALVLKKMLEHEEMQQRVAGAAAAAAAADPLAAAAALVEAAAVMQANADSKQEQEPAGQQQQQQQQQQHSQQANGQLADQVEQQQDDQKQQQQKEEHVEQMDAAVEEDKQHQAGAAGSSEEPAAAAAAAAAQGGEAGEQPDDPMVS